MKRLRHPKRLYSFLWHGLALVVITSALLLTSARLLLPTMEGYRSMVEGLASDFIGQPVRIGGLDAELIGLSPAFVFNDVALLTGPEEQPLVLAAELRAELDLLRSLRLRQPILRRLLIGGVDLTLTRSATGELRLSGLAASPAASGNQRFDAWLLSQGDVVLRDSRFVWRDETAGREHHFQALEIAVRNQGDRHQLNATVMLPEAMGRRLQVALDLTGDPRRPEDWEGELYLQAEGLLLDEWFAGRTLGDLRIDRGRMDATLWSTWRDGKVASVEGRVAADGLMASRHESAFRADHASAAIRWRQAADGWRLDLADAAFRREGRAWKPGRLSLERQEGEVRLTAAFLRIEDIAAGLTLTPVLPEKQRQLLRELAPRGDLQRIYASMGKDGYRLRAGFSDLAVQPHDAIPGFAGLEGEIQLERAEVRIALNARDATVELPRLFREPLRFSQLEGRVALAQTQAGWQLQGRRLTAANGDIRALMDIDMAVAPGTAPYLDLRGRFADGRGDAVRRYLPVHVMPAPTVAWLERAFGSGRIPAGTVVFRGRSADFPFRNGEGRFVVRFDAEAVDLTYQPDWPPLKALSAEVVFDGAAMRIAGRDGRFFGGRIRSANVSIPDLRRARLVIDGRADLPAADALRILRETPLARRFGRTFQGSSAEGQTGLRLHLEIPLRRGDPLPLAVRGRLALKQAALRMDRYLQLSHLDGALDFDQDGLAAKAVRAHMFGSPVRITVRTQDGITRFIADGTASGESLRRALGLPHLDRIMGETSWHGSLTVHGEGETELRIASDLKGMAIYLPNPLSKRPVESHPFVLRYVRSGASGGLAEIAYGDVLQSIFVLEPGGRGLARGAFHFGREMPALPEEPALQVTGSLTAIRPGEWGTLLRRTEGTAGRPLPVRVALHRLQLLSDKPAVLEPRDAGPASPLPPLSLHIRNLEFGAQRVGELMLESDTVGSRTEFSRLRLEGRHYALHGRGEWVPGDRRGRTRLELKLDSRDIGAMMSELGFASVITQGSTEASGELSWEGTLTDFDLAGLDGELAVAVEDGSIDELEPGGGRLLGLFSLAALPQRLRLDFSDIFKKGFAFQRIAGDLRFRRGQVFTDNLQTDAASARILMSGRTGIATEDYDMLVTVTPNVSDSIAVAGGLAIGPQAGALLWVLQKLFRIDEASRFQYALEGPWVAPEITPLSSGPDDRQ